MLEPLCLTALEARMGGSTEGAGNGQRLLFPDAEPAK